MVGQPGEVETVLEEVLPDKASNGVPAAGEGAGGGRKDCTCIWLSV